VKTWRRGGAEARRQLAEEIAPKEGRAKSYRDYVAWQKAIVFVGSIYEETGNWPKDEQFGLTNQVRRAAVSIPANFAEGQGRFGVNEWLHHLSIAHGSLCEVETHLMIAHQIGYLQDDRLASLLEQADKVGKLIRGLSRSLRT
jgi:four helix bundle protein